MPLAPIRDATEYLGRKWTPNFNCWDLVREIYAMEFGIPLAPHQIAVANAIHAAETEVTLEAAKSDVWTQVETPEPGDVVLFGKRFRRFHVGFMLFPDIVLHMVEKASSMAVPLSRVSSTFHTTTFYRHGSLHHCHKPAIPTQGLLAL